MYKKIVEVEVEVEAEAEVPRKTFVLPRLNMIDEAGFAGPLIESNLVFENFYAGCFPGENNDNLNRKNMITLLNYGITTFVCMQTEVKLDAREYEWRVTPAEEARGIRKAIVRPYFNDILNILAEKEKHPTLGTGVTNDVKFYHFPIKDLHTESDEYTLSAARQVVKCLENGEVIYLHCWGGHGRTGVIVCLVLHLIFGLSYEQALEYCELVHSMRTAKINVRSPQTDGQRLQVKRIIDSLTK